MTKAELLEAFAKSSSGRTKKQVNAVVNAVFLTVGEAIKKDGELVYPGFGSFRMRRRKARKGPR